MHPLILVVVFCVFAVFSVTARGDYLMLATALIVSIALLHRVSPWQRTGRMLLRLRWFLISITVFAMWFTPGLALFPALGAISPTVEGVIWGVTHVAALTVLVLNSCVLLTVLSREAFAQTLSRLFSPLALIGVSPNHLAWRLALTLDSVATNPQGLCGEKSAMRPHALGGWLTALAERLAERMACIERNSPVNEQTASIVPIAAPPPFQWGLPVIIALSFIAIGHW